MSTPGVIGIQIRGDASGLTAAVQGAGREVERFGSQAKDSADKIGALGNGLKSAFIGSSVAVGLIALKNNLAEFTQAMVDAQVQADKLRNGLNFAVGKANVGTELQFLRDQSKALGLDFATSAQQYTKLAAAARGTSLEGDKIRKVFESVAQASTVMGLSAEQTEGALLALTQIVSKGKVQAEELRGQLGERLPGAFQIAARAMNVTTGELDKMLETGKVLSTDFLPKFAAQLTQEVAPQVDEASKSMQASINRLNTAWMQFKQTVSGAGVSSIIATEASGIANYLTVLQEAMERAKQSGAGTIATLSTGLGTALARAPFDALAVSANALNGSLNFLTGGALKLNTNINLLPQAFETSAEKAKQLGGRLAAAESDLAALQARLKLNPENIYLKSQAYQAFLLAEELRAAKKAQDDLSGGDATRQGIVANGTGRLAVMERMAQEKKDREAARDKFFKEYATPQEKVTAEIEKQKKDMGELFTPEVERRIRENFIKPVKAAKESLDEWAKSVRNGYVGAMDEFGKIQDNAIKSTLGLTAAEEKLREVQASPEFAAMSRRQQENIILRAAEAMEAEKAAAAVKELADARKEEFNKAKSGADEQAKSLQRYEDESAAVAIAAQQNIALASAIELVAIKRLQEAQAIAMSYGDEDRAAELQREIDARRKLATLINDKDIRKKTEDENKKLGEQLENIITDGIFRGFENGKSIAENFADVLENTFKTMVLRPVIKATVEGFVGLDGGGGGIGGGISGFLGGLEKAGKVFDSFSLAATDFKTFAGNQAYELGGALTKAGFTETGNAITQYAGKFGEYAQTAGQVLGYLEAASNFKDGSYGKSIGQGIGLAISGGNPIIGQIGKTLGSYLDKWFGGGTYVQGQNSNVAYDAMGNQTYRGSVAAPYNRDGGEATDSLVRSIVGSYLVTANALGIKAASTSGGFATNDYDGGRYGLNLSVGGKQVFNRGETKFSEDALKLDASRAVFAALQGSELPGYLSKAFNGIIADTASQAQIDSALGFANSLKQIRFGLLSASEQAAEYQKIVDASTAALGTSAATFKADFVKAIDEGLTPEGLAKWVALGGTLEALEEITGKAADGLDEVVRSLKDIANERKRLQDELDQLTLSPEALLAKQRAAIDESNKALFDQVQAARAAKEANEAYAQSLVDAADAARTNTDNALAGVRRAVDAQRSIVQAQLSVAQESVSNLTSIFNTLKGGIQSLYGSADSVGAFNTKNATDFLGNALKNVKASGYLPDSTELADAVSTAISGTNSAVYATQADAEFARLQLAGTLSGLKDAAGTQLTTAEQAVKIAQSQLDSLDAQLKAAEQQVDALRGIDTSVLSVADAVKALGTAINAERAAVAAVGSGGGAVSGGSRPGVAYNPADPRTFGSGNPGFTYSTMTSAEASLAFALSDKGSGVFTPADTLAWADRAADATGKTAEQAIYDTAVRQGLSAADVATNTGYSVADINEWTRNAKLPALATGTNRIPQDGVYFLHKDEAVVPVAYNPAAGGSGGSNDALVEALIAEIKELRATVAIGNANTRRTAEAVNGNPDAPMLVTNA